MQQPPDSESVGLNDCVERGLNQHFEDAAPAIRLEYGKLRVTGDAVSLTETQAVAVMKLAVAGRIDHAQRSDRIAVVSRQKMPDSRRARPEQRLKGNVVFDGKDLGPQSQHLKPL